MNVRIALAIVISLMLPKSALACTDPAEPSFLDQLAIARSVSVVRLTSLRVADTAPESREIIGELEIIRPLKGKPTFRRISYSDIWCGGMRPLVGHYFVIATRSTGDTLRLVRGDNSIIDISDDYASTYPPRPERAKLQWHIANYLRGTPFPEGVSRYLSWANVHGSLPPPPPPPAQ